MSTDTVPPVASDLADERLRVREKGLRGTVAGVLDQLRGGDLGVLPVVAGLVVIAVVFQLLDPLFLSSRNLADLLLQSVPVGIIALGIVCILLVGEIDLSVGSVSGLSSALLGVLFVSRGLPVVLAILAAMAAGVAIGSFYSLLFSRFGIPSFVITLAGLLAFQGVQLSLLGATGSINLPFDSWIVTFAQLKFVPHWLSYVLVGVAAAGLFVSGRTFAAKRRAAGLSARSTRYLAVRSALLLVLAGFFVFALNEDRGVGWMVVVFLALTLALHYALTRTTWGTMVYAVGGNVEAARRAGINVRRIHLSVFVLCSTLAAVGGILAAARLGAANQGTGTGDVNLNAIAAAVIGGTSLFGGRGTAWAAPLGILVIQGIASGLTLLNLSSSIRFEVTGAVLVLAVGLDALSRRSRSSHGRA
jgi:simple sugar transport system permease protein/D-xylose transport system permease protein